MTEITRQRLPQAVQLLMYQPRRLKNQLKRNPRLKVFSLTKEKQKKRKRKNKIKRCIYNQSSGLEARFLCLETWWSLKVEREVSTGIVQIKKSVTQAKFSWLPFKKISRIKEEVDLFLTRMNSNQVCQKSKTDWLRTWILPSTL